MGDFAEVLSESSDLGSSMLRSEHLLAKKVSEMLSGKESELIVF